MKSQSATRPGRSARGTRVTNCWRWTAGDSLMHYRLLAGLLPRIGNRCDLPTRVGLHELKSINAAVAVLLVEPELVARPDGGKVVLDAHFGAEGFFIQFACRLGDGLNESIHALGP